MFNNLARGLVQPRKAGNCPELLTGRWFDIIFYIQTTLKKFKKVISKVMNILENIIENGAFASFFFAPKEQNLMLHFQ